MYSTDGINWTTASAAADDWRSVTYGDGKFVAVAQSGTNRVMYSLTGTGSTQAELTLTDSTNLANFRIGDAVTETSGDGTGTVSAIGAADLTLDSPTGTWSNAATVTGPTLTAATGTVASTSGSTMTLSSATGRFLVTEPGYETAKKLNKTVTAPSLAGAGPGAPNTEPPNAVVYTAVVNDAADTTNLTTYPLTDTELDPAKAYYSRVRYNDNAAVVSPYSGYNEFLTANSF